MKNRVRPLTTRPVMPPYANVVSTPDSGRRIAPTYVISLACNTAPLPEGGVPFGGGPIGGGVGNGWINRLSVNTGGTLCTDAVAVAVNSTSPTTCNARRVL